MFYEYAPIRNIYNSIQKDVEKLSVIAPINIKNEIQSSWEKIISSENELNKYFNLYEKNIFINFEMAAENVIELLKNIQQNILNFKGIIEKNKSINLNLATNIHDSINKIVSENDNQIEVWQKRLSQYIEAGCIPA